MSDGFTEGWKACVERLEWAKSMGLSFEDALGCAKRAVQKTEAANV